MVSAWDSPFVDSTGVYFITAFILVCNECFNGTRLFVIIHTFIMIHAISKTFPAHNFRDVCAPKYLTRGTCARHTLNHLFMSFRGTRPRMHARIVAGIEVSFAIPRERENVVYTTHTIALIKACFENESMAHTFILHIASHVYSLLLSRSEAQKERQQEPKYNNVYERQRKPTTLLCTVDECWEFKGISGFAFVIFHWLRERYTRSIHSSTEDIRWHSIADGINIKKFCTHSYIHRARDMYYRRDFIVASQPRLHSKPNRSVYWNELSLKLWLSWKFLSKNNRRDIIRAVTDGDIECRRLLRRQRFLFSDLGKCNFNSRI